MHAHKQLIYKDLDAMWWWCSRHRGQFWMDDRSSLSRQIVRPFLVERPYRASQMPAAATVWASFPSRFVGMAAAQQPYPDAFAERAGAKRHRC